MKEKFLLGLDLGTDSCGFCLTNQDGKIVRKNGKDLWGVRLFEEAQDCKERRSHRADRRRTQRRAQRIDLLQSLFAKEISKVDDKFFIRLNESKFKFEDKTLSCKYSLFNNEGFTDKDYFKKYPTIYHLRKDLIESKEKFDIRLIYLAFAHMIKYRGHFLFEGAKFNLSDKTLIRNSFDEISNLYKSIFDDEGIFVVSDDQIKEIINATNNTRGITKLKEKYQEILNKNKDKFLKDIIIPLLAGGSVSTSKIVTNNKVTEEVKSITCNDENFENEMQVLLSCEDENDQNKLRCVVEIKKIYDDLILIKLLKDSDSLSSAMVKLYENHRQDLCLLKKCVKKLAPKEYSTMFRKSEEKLPNYSAYIGSTNQNGITKRMPHCKKEDFYKYVKKILGIDKIRNQDDIADEDLKLIFIRMSDGSFLQRQNSAENRVLPYQLNLLEMETIINNQSKYYDFFNETDEFGTIAKKIESILTYKIPYYVGPLVDESKSKYAWVVKANEKIYPWNFSQVVDLEQTAEKFIKRMLNKCSYLYDQTCLPKDSILFNYFILLNELNKLFVNGAPISIEDKMDLISNVYTRKRKVTKKDVIEFFKSRYDGNVVIATSNNKEIVLHGSMKTYIDFSNVFGSEYVNNNIELIDNIITDCAIFEDKKMLEMRLKSQYELDDEKIKKIKGITINGFGTISRKLLMDLKGITDDGEILINQSIISAMQDSNYNFMEIINLNEYGFGTAIKEYNKEYLNGKITVEDYIDKLYVSPGMKRPLIQAYRIINELEKIVKHPIDEYYIECTRRDEKKEQKSSRKEKLLEIYKEAEKTSTFLYREKLLKCKELVLSKDDSVFKSDAVYLYFSQLGKDIYTGEDISFDDISNKNLYDIDHIYPQSLVKDDSFDNRVLVSSKVNSEKSDRYPIPYSLFGNNFNHYAFQKMLYDKKLISEEKFLRLTRVTPLEDNDLYNFVNRQIVYTSQSVKALKDLIIEFKTNNEGKTPKVILNKASISSDFRNDYDLLKSREANNAHHAHDAFLSVMIGRAVNTYFGSNLERIKYIKENNLSTNPKKIFINWKDDSRKDLVDSFGNIVWKYKNGETLKYISFQIKSNHNMLFSTRTYYGTELFSKVSIKPALQIGKDALPLKKGYDIYKYGGYSDLAFGSYSIFKITGKKNEVTYKLIAIPTIISNRNDKDILIDYVKKTYDLNNVELVFDKLKINTCVLQGDSKYCITGKTSNCFLIKNLKEAFYSYDVIKIIRKITKFYEMIKLVTNPVKNNDFSEEFVDKYKNNIVDKESFIIDMTKFKNETERIITKTELIKLYDAIIYQLNKNIYEAYSNIPIKQLINAEVYQKIVDMNIIDLTILLNEVLHLTQTNSTKSNLEKIGLSKTAGTLTIYNSLKRGMMFFAFSVTGFYSKKLWECK